jgi:hypothetical protein
MMYGNSIDGGSQRSASHSQLTNPLTCYVATLGCESADRFLTSSSILPSRVTSRNKFSIQSSCEVFDRLDGIRDIVQGLRLTS